MAKWISVPLVLMGFLLTGLHAEANGPTCTAGAAQGNAISSDCYNGNRICGTWGPHAPYQVVCGDQSGHFKDVESFTALSLDYNGTTYNVHAEDGRSFSLDEAMRALIQNANIPSDAYAHLRSVTFAQTPALYTDNTGSTRIASQTAPVDANRASPVHPASRYNCQWRSSPGTFAADDRHICPGNGGDVIQTMELRSNVGICMGLVDCLDNQTGSRIDAQALCKTANGQCPDSSACANDATFRAVDNIATYQNSPANDSTNQGSSQ